MLPSACPPSRRFAFSPQTALRIRDSLARRMRHTFGTYRRKSPLGRHLQPHVVPSAAKIPHCESVNSHHMRTKFSHGGVDGDSGRWWWWRKGDGDGGGRHNKSAVASTTTTGAAATATAATRECECDGNNNQLKRRWRRRWRRHDNDNGSDGDGDGDGDDDGDSDDGDAAAAPVAPVESWRM